MCSVKKFAINDMNILAMTEHNSLAYNVDIVCWNRIQIKIAKSRGGKKYVRGKNGW